MHHILTFFLVFGNVVKHCPFVVAVHEINVHNKYIPSTSRDFSHVLALELLRVSK